jgi:RimJ/RimL family protein N-acetyltransferase
MLPPQTEEQEWAWHEANMKSDTAAVFTIYELSSLRPIGNTGLFDISYRHRRAEFRIIIGERDCWGRGYGTETTRLVLEYGFTRLGLHNIMLRVFGYNERAQRAYARAGFKIIGRWRQAHNHGTQYDDVILMDCLSTEFPPQPGKQ